MEKLTMKDGLIQVGLYFLSDTLVIPAGKAVALDMNAVDVIHSIYIPAFRLKKDIVPGTPWTAWFVDTTSVFADAGANEKKASSSSRGRQIVQQLGCNACHSTDGTKIVGPSYLGLFAKTETVIADGKEKEITIDEEYLRRSILEPNSEVVKGYNKGLMLSYKDQLTDEEIDLIIEYIKTVK